MFSVLHASVYISLVVCTSMTELCFDCYAIIYGISNRTQPPAHDLPCRFICLMFELFFILLLNLYTQNCCVGAPCSRTPRPTSPGLYRSGTGPAPNCRRELRQCRFCPYPNSAVLVLLYARTKTCVGSYATVVRCVESLPVASTLGSPLFFSQQVLVN